MTCAAMQKEGEREGEWDMQKLWLCGGDHNEARDNKQGHNGEFGRGRRRAPTVSFSQAEGSTLEQQTYRIPVAV